MSNLGKYQDIVTSAKLVGGVDNLIAIIRNDAVAKAAPRLLFKGASLGAVGGALGIETGRRIVNHLRTKQGEREAAAQEAEDQLRAIVRDEGGASAAAANDRTKPPAASAEDGK